MTDLAIYSAAVDDVLGRYGDQLDGKVVVDITLSIPSTPSSRSTWRPGRRRGRSPRVERFGDGGR